MPTGTIGRIPLSPSTIKVASCPFALYCKVTGVPPDGRDPELSQYGKAAHGIFDGINRFMGVIDDFVVDKIVADYGAQDMVWMRKMALDYIKYFPLDRVIMSEQKLGLDINLQPCSFDDAAYRGIIDTILKEDSLDWLNGVQRTITLLDHKAGWKLQDPSCMQLKFYLWIFARNFPAAFDMAKLSMHFPRYKIFRTDNYIYKWGDIDRIEHSMLATARRIAESPLRGPAIPGAQCANCNWISRCPVPDEEMTEIYTEAQAQELAGQIRVLDIRMRDMKRKLRSFIGRNNNAPVILKDYNYMFGHTDQVRWEADVREIVSKLKENADLISNLRVQDAVDLIGHEAGIDVRKNVVQVYKGQGFEPPNEEEDFEEIKA